MGQEMGRKEEEPRISGALGLSQWQERDLKSHQSPSPILLARVGGWSRSEHCLGVTGVPTPDCPDQVHRPENNQAARDEEKG